MKSKSVLSLGSDFFNVLGYHNIQKLMNFFPNNDVVEVSKIHHFKVNVL